MTARKNEFSRQLPERELTKIGVQVSFYLFPDEHEKLRKMAYLGHASLAEMLRRLIRRAEIEEE